MHFRDAIQWSYPGQVSGARRVFRHPPCRTHELVLKDVAIRTVSCSVVVSDHNDYEELVYLNHGRAPPAGRNLRRDR